MPIFSKLSVWRVYMQYSSETLPEERDFLVVAGEDEQEDETETEGALSVWSSIQYT